MSHKTVLLKEAVDGLQLHSSASVVDATFGSGGHAAEILRHLDAHGTYVGIDVDETAFAGASLPATEATVHLVNDNFKNLTEILRSLHIDKVDAILADLGWRMEQFSESGKGFSFQKEEPLAMTFGDPKQYSFTAHDIVNDWDEETLANIFYGYADERYARRIARAIVLARKGQIISTTHELVEIIKQSVPISYQRRKIHPATKAFQALRIAVNDELGVLEQFIDQALIRLQVGGRLGIITFHSIEDRIVKQTFRTFAKEDRALLVTKKPLVPEDEEMSANPRARSAKLRILEKM